MAGNLETAEKAQTPLSFESSDTALLGRQRTGTVKVRDVGLIHAFIFRTVGLQLFHITIASERLFGAPPKRLSQKNWKPKLFFVGTIDVVLPCAECRTSEPCTHARQALHLVTDCALLCPHGALSTFWQTNAVELVLLQRVSSTGHRLVRFMFFESAPHMKLLLACLA